MTGRREERVSRVCFGESFALAEALAAYVVGHCILLPSRSGSQRPIEKCTKVFLVGVVCSTCGSLRSSSALRIRF